MKLKLVALGLSALLSTNIYANAQALTFLNDYTTKTGETVTIKSKHTFRVTNFTHQTQNYLVTEILSVKGKETRCPLYFTLSPGATKKDDKTLQLMFSAQEKGTYEIKAITIVAGTPAATHLAKSKLKVE